MGGQVENGNNQGLKCASALEVSGQSVAGESKSVGLMTIVEK